MADNENKKIKNNISPPKMKGLYEYFSLNQWYQKLSRNGYHSEPHTPEDQFFKFVECLFGKEKKNRIAILAIQNRGLFKKLLYEGYTNLSIDSCGSLPGVIPNMLNF